MIPSRLSSDGDDANTMNATARLFCKGEASCSRLARPTVMCSAAWMGSPAPHMTATHSRMPITTSTVVSCHPLYLPPSFPPRMPTCLLAYRSTCLLTYRPARLLAFLTTCLPVFLPACLPACRPACLPVCLRTLLPACSPTFLPACVPNFPACPVAYPPACLLTYYPARLHACSLCVSGGEGDGVSSSSVFTCLGPRLEPAAGSHARTG